MDLCGSTSVSYDMEPFAQSARMFACAAWSGSELGLWVRGRVRGRVKVRVGMLACAAWSGFGFGFGSGFGLGCE